MQESPTMAALPRPRQRLVALMQTINFGRIEDLNVRGGDPVFDGSPRVVHEFKFGGENGPRPEREVGDLMLKNQVGDLFRQVDRLGTATIEVLEVKHGLPFRMFVADSVS